MRTLFLILVAVLSGCAAHTPRPPVDAPPPEAAEAVTPEEAAAICEHLAGEDPYDEDRRAFLNAQMAKYCRN